MLTSRYLVEAMFRAMTGGAEGPWATIAGHLGPLYLLARYFAAGGLAVELGVGRGYSTTALLAGLREVGGHLISVDVDPQAKAKALETMQFKDDVHGWTFWVDRGDKAAARVPDREVGLFFLDTTHTLEDTRNELAAWAPKMRPDGVMCGHDYLLHEDPKLRWAGVKQAVDEFLERNNKKYRLQVLPWDKGLWILWPRT